MPNQPERPDPHVHWTKEVQRRAMLLEAARNRGASAEEIARLAAEVDEAERMRREST